MDHAISYLDLLEKLRDREAVAMWLFSWYPDGRPNEEKWCEAKQVTKDFYLQEADALLAHLGLTAKGGP